MRFWLEVAFLFCGCGQLRVTLSAELATLSGSGLVLRMAHKHWVRGRQSLMVAIDCGFNRSMQQIDSKRPSRTALKPATR
ncbi:hypothetical protein EMIT051CA3_20947 [Pseudomonas chlororaphis]